MLAKLAILALAAAGLTGCATNGEPAQVIAEAAGQNIIQGQTQALEKAQNQGEDLTQALGQETPLQVTYINCQPGSEKADGPAGWKRIQVQAVLLEAEWDTDKLVEQWARAHGYTAGSIRTDEEEGSWQVTWTSTDQTLELSLPEGLDGKKATWTITTICHPPQG